MTKKRRNHSAEFKAKLALATAKGYKTVAELAQKYNQHPKLISTSKKELLENATMIFASENQLSILTVIAVKYCPGGYPTLWIRAFVSKLLRKRFSIMDRQISSTQIKAVSLLALSSHIN